MATQGLVSVRRGGEVVMKIVVGIDGMKAPEVAVAIREMGCVPTFEEAEKLCSKIGFGSYGDRVIMTKANVSALDNLSELYRATFDDPNFNPRWHHGTADYVEIVDL